VDPDLENINSSWFRDARKFSDSLVFSWEDTGCHSGNRCIKISSSEPNDARWVQSVNVEQNTKYLLAGWIKTKNVMQRDSDYARIGANLGILESGYRSGGIFNTNDWMFVSLHFNSGELSQISVTCRLGYYSGYTFFSGLVTGEMWCDDYSLTKEE
jgi:hypothetical protein